MITQLYTFSAGSYVVAEEWNANFRTLYNANVAHEEAITDAYAQIAFPTSNLSDLFSAVNSQLNSFAIAGNSVTVAPECEYYKTLSSGEDLVINIPAGLSGEARVLIRIQEDRPLKPFTINYSGTKQESLGTLATFPAGIYMLFIFETNGLAQIKVTKTTGV